MSNLVEIKYTGPSYVRRSVDEYVWEAANGFLCKVPSALAASLLTDPSGEFALTGEPISKTAQKGLSKELGVEVTQDAE